MLLTDGMYIPEPNSGCWIWLGGLSNGGYGPHKDLYETYKKRVENGFELHHKCEVRCCINLDHLEEITVLAHRRLHLSQASSHCKNGHEVAKYGHFPLVMRYGKMRPRFRCKECGRIWERKRKR